jgi:hypothetical protein
MRAGQEKSPRTQSHSHPSLHQLTGKPSTFDSAVTNRIATLALN